MNATQQRNLILIAIFVVFIISFGFLINFMMKARKKTVVTITKEGKIVKVSEPQQPTMASNITGILILLLLLGAFGFAIYTTILKYQVVYKSLQTGNVDIAAATLLDGRRQRPYRYIY